MGFGVFLTIDPLLNTGDPQSINGYSYSDDDPINASDPSGAELLMSGGGGYCSSSCEATISKGIAGYGGASNGGWYGNYISAVSSGPSDPPAAPGGSRPSGCRRCAYPGTQNPLPTVGQIRKADARLDTIASAAGVVSMLVGPLLSSSVRAQVDQAAMQATDAAHAVDQVVGGIDAAEEARAAAALQGGCSSGFFSCLGRAFEKIATNKYVVGATVVIGGVALAATGVGILADAAAGADEIATVAGVSTETISTAADTATAASTVVDGVGCYAGDSLACAGAAFNGGALGFGRYLIPALGGSSSIAGGLAFSGAVATGGAGFGMDFSAWVRSMLGGG